MYRPGFLDTSCIGAQLQPGKILTSSITQRVTSQAADNKMADDNGANPS